MGRIRLGEPLVCQRQNDGGGAEPEQYPTRYRNEQYPRRVARLSCAISRQPSNRSPERDRRSACDHPYEADHERDKPEDSHLERTCTRPTIAPVNATTPISTAPTPTTPIQNGVCSLAAASERF